MYDPATGKKAKIGYTGEPIELGRSRDEAIRNGMQAYIDLNVGKNAVDLSKGFNVTYYNNIEKGYAYVIITADADNTLYAGNKVYKFKIDSHKFDTQKDLINNK